MSSLSRKLESNNKLLGYNASIEPVLYTLLMFLCFVSTGTIFGISFNYWFRYALALIWIVYCLFISYRRGIKTLYTSRYLLLLLAPFIIMLVHNPLAYIINGQSLSFDVISRVFSYLLQRIILICLPLFSIPILRGKTIKCTFIALSLAYLLFVLEAIYIYGFRVFTEYLFTVWQDKWNEWHAGRTIVNTLEVHDITFTFGFFFLYYLLFYRGKKTHRITGVLVSFIFMWLGFKRIEMLAIVTCVVAFFIFVRLIWKSKNARFWCFVAGTVVLTFELLFVYFVKSGELVFLIEKFGIETNGRLSNYSILANYYNFDLFFFGRGYCFTTHLVESVSDLSLVHSDILRSFIDFGFIGFCAWVLYYTFVIPLVFTKDCHCSSDSKRLAATVFLVFSIFSMLNYVTDNVYSYFCYQTTYFIIPLSILFKGKIENA